jgi:hypothetical protein
MDRILFTMAAHWNLSLNLALSVLAKRYGQHVVGGFCAMVSEVRHLAVPLVIPLAQHRAT